MKLTPLDHATDITKTTITEVSQQFVALVKDGVVNASKVLTYMKYLEGITKTVRAEIMEDCVEELEANGGTLGFGTVQMKKKEAGTRYKFDQCNSPELNAVMTKLEPLLERKKALEQELKYLSGSKTVVDEDSGEVQTVFPAQKTSTTIVEVTIK